MTLQKIALLGTALTALCLPVAAQAATAAAPHAAAGGDIDARCLAVSMVMVGSTEPGARNMGAQGVSYFFGRIDGHPTKADLETRLSAQFALFTPQTVTPAAKECMGIMNARGATFRTVTEHLQKKYGRTPPAAGAPGAAAPAPAQAAPAVPAQPH